MTELEMQGQGGEGSIQLEHHHEKISLEALPKSCKGPWLKTSIYGAEADSCSSTGLQQTQYWKQNACFKIRSTGHYTRFATNSTTNLYQQEVFNSSTCSGKPLYFFPNEDDNCVLRGSHHFKDGNAKCLPVGHAPLVIGYFPSSAFSFDTTVTFDSGIAYVIPSEVDLLKTQDTDITNFGKCKTGAPMADEWTVNAPASTKSYTLKCEKNHINGYVYTSTNCAGKATKYTDVYEFDTGLSDFASGLIKKTFCF